MLNFLSIIVLIFIVMIPIALITLAIIVLYKKVLGSEKKEKNRQKPTYTYKGALESEWKWNEETKLWEHPLSVKSTKTEENTNNNQCTENTRTSAQYSTEYSAKMLLTKNEWYEYRKLKDYASQKNLMICPKVRLLDIVEPRQGKGFMTRFHKVASKHVDFVLTDSDLHIKAILELDDNSHDLPERKERDRFVDAVLTGVGYKVIHTRSITQDTLKDL